MEQQIRNVINDVFPDLEASLGAVGETLCAQGLADCVGDCMIDSCEEYRAMPYAQRRALVLSVCRQYV